MNMVFSLLLGWKGVNVLSRRMVIGKCQKKELVLLLAVCLIPACQADEGDNLTYGISKFYDGMTYGVVNGTTSKIVQIVYIPSYRQITVPGSSSKWYQIRGIGEQAFINCSNLTDIIFRSEKLLRIDRKSFDHCTKLKSIVIPEYVREIGNAAFNGCWSLESVTLSDSLRRIADAVFEGCSKLESVTFPDSLQVVGIYAFHKCTGLKNMIINKGLTTIDSCAFLDCSGLKSVEFGSSLKSIGRSAFRGCVKLEAAFFPSSLTQIKTHAFYGCSSLGTVVFSRNLTELAPYAFSNCTSLKTISFPESKSKLSIRSHVFENCTCLTTIDIHDNVFRIYDNAFKNCISLPTITLPASMSAIGESAFEGCVSLDTVISLVETPFQLEKDVFKNISPKSVLVVHYSKKNSYIAAGWTEEIFRGGIVELPDPLSGISSVKVRKGNKKWYDLDGHEITVLEKGRIYIRDGKKIRLK